MKHNLLESFDTEVKSGLFNALKPDNPSIENTIFQHLSIVHASILGGLIQKCKKENGSKAIKNLIELGNHKGDILDHIKEIFASKQKLTDIKKLGNSLLSFVFDEGTDTAFENIQHFLSDKYDSNEEDLIEVNRVVAPFSMALLGQIVHFEKLSESQIETLLEFNESIITNRYPGLAGVLGLHTQHEEKAVQELPTTKLGEDGKTPSEPIEKKEPRNGRTSQEDTKTEAREAFLRALWPWVLLLIISGIALFILKKYQDDSEKVVTDNTFPFIQNDSVVLDVEKNYTLPGNIPLTVDRNGTLDTIMMHIEKNQGISDTLRFQNSIIKFENSSSVLTTNANTQLGGIVAILQAHPAIQMVVNMNYDSAFFNQHHNIVIDRIQNLSNYFKAFGLQKTSYDIRTTVRKSIHGLNRPNSTTLESDTIKTTESSASSADQRVDLIFFQKTKQTSDSLNIQ